MPDSRLKPAGKTSGRDYGNDWVHETKRMADAGNYKKEDAGTMEEKSETTGIYLDRI
ncbi:hypothetical protein ACFL6G_02620 [candidate division KSB1 bacterium]